MMIPAPEGRAYLPYQLKGINYALGARGTIIADEMGLGKTVQAIGVINALPLAERVLIVAPAGLVTNWKCELSDWYVEPNNKAREVVLTSYHGAESIESPGPRGILIVDEAHYIKHAETQRAQRIARLAKFAGRVVLLTGTPMENCPIELWPLLKIACPEVWDPPIRGLAASYTVLPDRKKTHPDESQAFWDYAVRYCNLKRICYQVGREGVMRSAWDFSGSSNAAELGRKLKASCMIRRLKADVLPELPPKRRQLIVLKAKGAPDSMFPEVNDNNYFDILGKLTADKALFTEYSKKRHAQALAKVDESVEFIENALDGADKIIVFAHHGDVIAALAEGLKAFNPRIATGATHVADRGAAVHAFQNDPSVRLFIGSIGAAGVGITLTAASVVIFVELDPVPGRMTQAEDRAHRIGQRESLLVYLLVRDGTLCARMAKICARKQAVLSEVLDVHGATLTYAESSENDRLP